MNTILITGANRGLGLELARQYVERGERVFAACRKPESAGDLKTLAGAYPDRVTVIGLDVTDSAAIDAAYAQVAGAVNALDMLINNAGIIREEPTFHQATPDNLRAVLETNVVGVLAVTQRFLPLLEAAEQPFIINISSNGGSISRRESLHNTSYATSKTALNMLNKMMANNLREAGIAAVTMHPGWVRTDMGGPEADLSIREAMVGMVATIDTFTMEHSGRFINWDGEEIPW